MILTVFLLSFLVNKRVESKDKNSNNLNCGAICSFIIICPTLIQIFFNFIFTHKLADEHQHYKKLILLVSSIVSQTLFGNPKGSVELGNPNTCAETKLCLNFILFRLKK